MQSEDRNVCLATLRLAMAFSLLVVFANERASAQQPPPLEYQVKASYIFNFLQFSSWHDDERFTGKDAIVVALVGEDRFGQAFDALQGALVHRRKIHIKRFRKISEIDACDVLFISASMQGHLPRLFDKVHGRGILTIGESAEFARQGGIIGLVLVDGKVRFEINLEAARAAGIELSSHLLRLSTAVYGGENSK